MGGRRARLDGVPQRRPRAVHLQRVHVLRRQVPRRERGPQHLLLRGAVRRLRPRSTRPSNLRQTIRLYSQRRIAATCSSVTRPHYQAFELVANARSGARREAAGAAVLVDAGAVHDQRVRLQRRRGELPRAEGLQQVHDARLGARIPIAARVQRLAAPVLREAASYRGCAQSK